MHFAKKDQDWGEPTTAIFQIINADKLRVNKISIIDIDKSVFPNGNWPNSASVKEI